MEEAARGREHLGLARGQGGGVASLRLRGAIDSARGLRLLRARLGGLLRRGFGRRLRRGLLLGGAATGAPMYFRSRGRSSVVAPSGSTVEDSACEYSSP